MEAKAIAKYVRISSMKVSVVLDLIRGKDINEAFAILQYTPKDASGIVTKLLKSAVANAENNFSLDKSRLYVSETYACAGPTLKDFSRMHKEEHLVLKREPVILHWSSVKKLK